MEVNSRRREVIGIMPPGADVLDIRPEIWLPLGLTPSNPGNRRGHSLRVIGRLKDEVTAEAAQTELKTLNEQWGERVGVTDHMFAPMPAMPRRGRRIPTPVIFCKCDRSTIRSSATPAERSGCFRRPPGWCC